MATVEERLAFLEGRVGEHGVTINGIRDALEALEARMDRRFDTLDRRFTWLIGLQVMTMASVLSAFVALVG